MGRKILLVESDRSYLKILEEYVAQMDIFDSYQVASNGLQAVELALEYQPDLVVTALVLPEIDGFGVISVIKEKLPNTIFIISTTLKTDFAVRQANEMGVQLYFAKPTSFEVFRSRIVDLLNHRGTMQNLVVQKEDQGIMWLITREIQKLGFPANLKGFKFVRYAIYLMIEDEMSPNMMNGIYPAVAEKFGTSPACVERNIRNGIENTWIYGSMSYIDEVFGFTVDADKGKPTNTAFIMTVAERIRLNI